MTMPLCMYFASSSVAARINDISGSPVLRSGVGTQMLTASIYLRTEKSVVAVRCPDLTSLSTVSVCTSGIYDVPLLIESILRISVSIPVTWNPASPKTAARGKPSYPSPRTAMRAFFSFRFLISVSLVAISSFPSTQSPSPFSAKERGQGRGQNKFTCFYKSIARGGCNEYAALSLLIFQSLNIQRFQRHQECIFIIILIIAGPDSRFFVPEFTIHILCTIITGTHLQKGTLRAFIAKFSQCIRQ